ncbi:flagellin [Acetobacteraceae bacterium KSS8]|uniref:Flagellin n=1 Tax=Endosaccharibacter trunci TaxID=2812733 RepID=A0ABT1WAG7_9PROT|nr:flagellin [Acetobacteraceae bacterium KSS8]
MTIPSINGGSPSMLSLTGALDRLNSQYTSLQSQTASGVVSDSYAGLGSNRYQALSLQPQLTAIGGWQQNVSTAQNNLSVAQTALSQIASIANTLQTNLITLQSDQSASTVSAVATQARQALTTLASLANTQNGNIYVFGGTQQDSPPLSDPGNILQSNTVTSIGASVASLGTTGADAVESATLAAASDNSPGQSLFSSALSTDPVTANAQAQSTIVGSDNQLTVGFVLTGGTAPTSGSTGSPIRDLIRQLAVVASLPSADSSSPAFSSLVNTMVGSVQATGAAITNTQAALGQTQSDLTTQSGSLSTLSDALTAQLGSLKDADPATVATQLSDIRNQLTASYSLIADMKGLSLASYI